MTPPDKVEGAKADDTGSGVVGTPAPPGFENFIRSPRIDASFKDTFYADDEFEVPSSTRYDDLNVDKILDNPSTRAAIDGAGDLKTPTTGCAAVQQVIPQTPDHVVNNPDVTYNNNPVIFGGPEPDFAVGYSGLTVAQTEYLISCFIAGKTSKWVRKHFYEKHKILLRNDSLYQFKRRNAELIEAGIKIRHERVRREGLSLIEERVIALEEHADQLLARMKDDMSAHRPPSIRLMKEYRETLNDIAIELGHRRKGMDVSNEMVVSVVKIPPKAVDRETWEIQAQELLGPGE